MENAKKIVGFDNYEISEAGFVTNTKTGRVLRPSKIGKGYYDISLCRKGKQHHFYIHRLVATYFIANPENKAHVNHKNGIMTDNRVFNLEWATPKENIQHAYATGLVAKSIKVAQGARYTKEDVLEIRAMFAGGHSKAQIARDMDMSHMNVTHIVNRKTWSHI